ncbi:MAG: AsmA family protein [Rhodospirillaceae bacterium]|nr:AsmA family protein [Rhodospirillaceae bacterium]
MKKILIGLGGFLVVLIAAILIVPDLVDWNDYKAEITSRAKAETGRNLIIDGDIRLSVLPTPALVAENVRLSNIKGAAAPDMVNLKSLQVRVALGPLLSGQIQVKTVRLIKPLIELERLADGRVNWDFSGVEKQTKKKPKLDDDDLTAGSGTGTERAATSGAAPTASGPDIILDSFIIEEGIVVFRDLAAGTVERVEHINADIAAASLIGPFESDGDLVLRGVPIHFDATIGKIIEGRTAPVSLALDVAPGATRLTVSGAVVGIEAAPKFKGKVSVKGDKLSGLVQGVTAGTGLPGLMSNSFEVSADVVAGAEGVEVEDLKVGLGNVMATGSAAVELGKSITARLDLAADSVDADKLLALPPIDALPTELEKKKAASPAAKKIAATAPAAVPAKEASPNDAFSLPDNINASVRLTAKSVSVKGGLVRDVRMDAELASGEITVSQVSAQLPGSADVAAFGFIVPEKGVPQFDGEVEVSVGDLRGVLDWLKITPPPVPADRLRKLTLAANLKADPKQVRLEDIDMQFDSSRLTGSVQAGLSGNTPVAADLILDRINLDAYLGTAPKAKKKSVKASAKDSAKAASMPPAPPMPPMPTAQIDPARAKGDPLAALSSLSALKTLNAKLKAQIKTLIYRGAPIKDVLVDGALTNNTLNLKNLSIAKMAGAKIKVGGIVSDLVGVPDMKNLHLDVATGDVARLLRMAGINAPVDSRKMGAVSLKARADGSLLRPVVDTTIKGAGGSLQAKGKVSLLPIFEGFDGNLTIKHKNMAALVRALGTDYRPAGKLGPVDFQAALKARATGMDLTNIKGKVGPLDMSGTASVALSGPRTKLTAVLKTGEIVTDNFMPASSKASLSQPYEFKQGFQPAAFDQGGASLADPAFRRMAALSSGRWSTDPLDLSFLKAFDADVKMISDALIYGNYRITNADLAATVDAGVMQVERFKGNLFGGTIDSRGTVTAANPSRFDTSVSLKSLSVSDALAAVAGKKLAKGTAALELKLASSGYTISDMVAALGGNGSVAMNKLDVKSGAIGTPMAAAFGLISGLNDLGGVLTGSKKKSGLADITGTFTLDKGVARFNDFALKSGMGNGQASGSADLARWMVDVKGSVTVSQSFLGQILSSNQATTQTLPFSVAGRLDAPNVKLDTSMLQAAGLPIPGLDKVLKKNKVGRVLQQLIPGLGGTAPKTAQPSSPPAPGDTPPPPPPTQQQQKVKPADLLKGLLKGLGR